MLKLNKVKVENIKERKVKNMKIRTHENPIKLTYLLDLIPIGTFYIFQDDYDFLKLGKMLLILLILWILSDIINSLIKKQFMLIEPKEIPSWVFLFTEFESKEIQSESYAGNKTFSNVTSFEIPTINEPIQTLKENLELELEDVRMEKYELDKKLKIEKENLKKLEEDLKQSEKIKRRLEWEIFIKNISIF